MSKFLAYTTLLLFKYYTQTPTKFTVKKLTVKKVIGFNFFKLLEAYFTFVFPNSDTKKLTADGTHKNPYQL